MSPVIKAMVAVSIISIGHLIVAAYCLLVYSGTRTKGLRQEAEAMGLSFTPSMDTESLDAVGHFGLFSKGKTRQVSNVFQGNVDGVDAMMFDCGHVTRGVSGSARRYSAAFFHSDRLNLPPFITKDYSLRQDSTLFWRIALLNHGTPRLLQGPPGVLLSFHRLL